MNEDAKLMHNAVARHLLADAQTVPKQSCCPCSPHPSWLPLSYCSAWRQATWDTALASLGWLSCVSPPAPGPWFPLLTGLHEELKCPGLCASTALQQLKHRSFINTVFIKNSKHGTIPSATKKIISAETRTYIYKAMHSKMYNLTSRLRLLFHK